MGELMGELICKLMGEPLCYDFWVGVLSNIATPLLVAGTILIFYLPYTFLSWLRPILKFFGVTSSNPNLTIYCSRITTLPGGTTGNVQVGQKGPVISLLEWQAAEKVRDLLRGRVFPILPKGWQNWLHDTVPSWTPLVPKITLSEERQSQILSGLFAHSDYSLDSIISTNIVLIGSSAYNTIVELLETRRMTAAYFSSDDLYHLRCFRDIDGFPLDPTRKPLLDEKGEPIRDAGGKIVLSKDSAEGAFIQRIILKNGKTIIICAGTSSNATLNAVTYLVQNWKKSQYMPPKGAFAYYLAWRGLQPEAENDIQEPSRVYELLKLPGLPN